MPSMVAPTPVHRFPSHVLPAQGGHTQAFSSPRGRISDERQITQSRLARVRRSQDTRNPPAPRRAPQGHLRAPRPRLDRHHPGHLQPRDAGMQEEAAAKIDAGLPAAMAK